ncbi:MAG: MATE family efflux transporter [Sphingomonadales bacterium]|nr:MATE family efflux transporter [Sphingomonadales bacterium]MBD3774368.1 MATE family efflux transporter [Paracoccaceae bacterium]
MSEVAKLTRGSIRGHLVSQTLPMVIGVAAMMSIGLVDAYFVGRLGSTELAAMAFIFPVTVAITSLGVGVMVGINSVVARALGEGDHDRALRKANFGIVFAVLLGIAMAALLLVLQGPLFTLMQARPAVLPVIRDYMTPYALGFPISLAIMGVNGVLRGQGEARRTSIMSITYAAANWVLDPLLITGAFGFKGYGIAGAAYATVAGWAIAALLGLWLLRTTSLPFHPSVVARCNVRDTVGPIVKVAGPAAFSNAINPIGLSVLTALVAAQGEAAVAGFGAGGRLQSFAVVPLLGLSGSIGAIVGQNWGARQYDRARLAMFEAGLFSVVYGLVLAAIFAAAGGWFGSFFSDDPAVVHQVERYLHISAWGYAGFGLLITANGALNAVDRAHVSLLQSAARVFLVMLPFAWLMRPAWGADAIYAAELAANLIGGGAAGLIVWRVLTRTQTPPNQT